MKKLLRQMLVIAIIFVILGLANAVSALTPPTGSVKLSADKDTYSAKDTVIVTLSFPEFNFNETDVVFIGTVDYDKDKLEIVSMASAGNWSELRGEDYDLSKGSFILSSTNAPSAGSAGLIVTFKVKDNAELGETTVTLSKIDCLKGTFNLTPAKFTIAQAQTPVPSPTPTPSPAPATPDSGNSGAQSTPGVGTQTSPATQTPNRLPQTGKNDTVLLCGIALCVIASIVTAILYIKNTKK